MSKISGSWKLDFEDSDNTISINKGKVTLQGKPAQLFVSTNPKYPTSDGWSKVVTYDGKVCVAKLTGSSDELQIVMFKGDDEVAATVTYKGTTPEPEIPTEGNCD